MGIEVVLVYLVVGTVETVTDQLEKHLLLFTSYYEYDNCSANHCNLLPMV